MANDKSSWQEKAEKKINEFIADRDLQEAVASADNYQDVEKLAVFGQRFKCSVCNKPAKHPKKNRRPLNNPARALDWVSEDWNDPTDREMCLLCNKWVCTTSDCSHKGICKTCALKS